jgi:phosphoglycolate phosphatase
MKIFCDLDGTLIDVSKRHYRVYCEMTSEFGGTPLPKDTYWDLKRRKTKWNELLPLSDLDAEVESKFLEGFIKKIEDPQYLMLDELFPSSIVAVNELSKLGDCYLVSLRRNRENLLDELTRLELAPHFREVLTGHSENDGYDVKIALIKDRLGDENGIIIGDTEADIVTGKELGMKSIALKSGIRDEQFLSALEPDYLLDDISQVVRLIPRL